MKLSTEGLPLALGTAYPNAKHHFAHVTNHRALKSLLLNNNVNFNKQTLAVCHVDVLDHHICVLNTGSL